MKGAAILKKKDLLKIFKFFLILLFICIFIVLIIIGKCKYEEIDQRITEGSGYGLSIGSTFSDVINVLKKVPEEYPNATLHYYKEGNNSVPISWDSINQISPSDGLFLVYDTHSNYLDFLDISFNDNKVSEMNRIKFCALNTEYKASHRCIASLLGLDG
ncbi:hypothetical protein [Marinomonas sp.]|uniref:hypothetical protein n=1 Tax=Marinomonas sp. TaxID=1904862 RepID=UPI003A8E3D5D